MLSFVISTDKTNSNKKALISQGLFYAFNTQMQLRMFVVFFQCFNDFPL